jgi:hypothetical protein
MPIPALVSSMPMPSYAAGFPLDQSFVLTNQQKNVEAH